MTASLALCRPLCLLLLGALLSLGACRKASTRTTPHRILALSHLRTPDPFILDSEVAQIPFQAFERLLLGGDLAENTSGDTATLEYLNKIYHLDQPNTLWTMGNHDTANPQLIQQTTGRPLFYAQSWQNTTLIVLNSQDTLGRITAPQQQLLSQILDTLTLTHTQYLLLLTHKLLWMPGNPDLEAAIDSVANGNLGTCHYCTRPNNFYDDIYPRLQTAQQNGVQVICLAGDIGVKVKTFEYQTPDGIWFLATGIAAGTSGNRALVFELDPHTRRLSWHFRPLLHLF